MGTWSVVMSAVGGCTLLFAATHSDQGEGVKTIKLPLLTVTKINFLH